MEKQSPSHTVGLEQRYLAWEVGTGKTISPSHAVGLEQGDRVLSDGSGKAVIIPHGGLRTRERNKALVLYSMSPSHTVGLEQKRKLCFYFFMLRNSHHPTQWAWNKKSYTLS